jgi:hypothetical protein
MTKKSKDNDPYLPNFDYESSYGATVYSPEQRDPVALLRTIANDTARHDATLAELTQKLAEIHLLVGQVLAKLAECPTS